MIHSPGSASSARFLMSSRASFMVSVYLRCTVVSMLVPIHMKWQWLSMRPGRTVIPDTS